MLKSVFIILLYQLIGELFQKFFGLSIPGPVIGLVLLLLTLLLIQKRQRVVPIKEDLFNSAEILLNYLPLLFIPVGVGVVMHLSLLEDNLASVVFVIILGTLSTLALTGYIMEKILRKKTLDD
jgi:holin-like protein|tara:strand:+ start:360 stop:728 length:369 start_codon:yes stop_codon:yes gene_type:complete